MIGSDTFAYFRDLPHLQKEGKAYFVTFVTHQRRILEPTERDIVLDCIRHDDGVTCTIIRAVVMPDHVHLLFRTDRDYSLAQIMRRIKGVSARLINQYRQASGSVWQREYFDHILRSCEDLCATAAYIEANPVRAGLVDRVEDYAWGYRGRESD